MNVIKILKKKMVACRDIFQHLQNSIKNFNRPVPIYVDSKKEGMKIHLGAGLVNIQGWINIDARSNDHIHLVITNFDLAEFSDGSISEIYMCHVLEHFSFVESEILLKNLRRKLCKGGLIRISVPCFDKLIHVYNKNKNDIELIKLAIMGGQDYEFNFHKSIYNYASLLQLLEVCGYVHIKEWDTITDFGTDLGDWSNKTFPLPDGEQKISLNLKGRNPVD